MSEKTEQVKEDAAKAARNKKVLGQYVNALSGSSRRERQNASAVLAQAAHIAPDRLVDHVDDLIDALNRPEAQTRWECLDALTEMVAVDSRACDKALVDAETALFDEESGTVRLAAVRFLCRLGATTENRSDKVWPLLDEAIQCYHGDLEYQDMLVAIISFSEGKLSDEARNSLIERVTFDATNAKGALGRRSKQIVENLKAGKKNHK